MSTDVRRCRRCKRKRLDDEPMEVRQYRTCAKCRIIERNKKKSRKPLAEETMLYGLKQFREQSLSDNFMEEEGLLDDEYFRQFHKKPFNYEAEINRVLTNPNYVPPIIDEARLLQKDTSGSHEISSKIQIKPVKPQQQNISIPEITVRQHKPKKHEIVHPQEVVKDDDIFEELAELGNEEELTSDITASQAIVDPYLYGNVYDNFQQYLLTVFEKRQNKEDINNLVFLKEFNEDFTSNMAKFDAHSRDRSPVMLNAKLNERQVRLHLLSNLKALYIDPIIAVMNIRYHQESSNINDFKSTNFIKSCHRFISHEKFNSASEARKIKSSTIYLTFNKKYNLLVVKLSHLIYRPSGIKYTGEFKSKIQDIFKKLQFEKEMYNSKLKDTKLDYNETTANLIYDKLFSLLDLCSDELQEFIKKLDKDDFIRDFINFEDVFKSGTESDEEGEAENDEAADEPMPDADEGVQSEDENMDAVNDTSFTENTYSEIKKESTAEVLDPVLKPE
ncbi:uncharacterized protein J8A68_003781 [[Candida] subhashii]|uniref:Uncharacterized protein n=1 Tax=[Candida] subhashii TaxID=561895 RepID=A0A8J5QLV9_9ASCO|nr:uncharacterized protein J8A68_003781 [[Candida] subhashii]KAG7662722.1 hypothetical protein J8A68_003781 [[Candida] subhashii]